jgi:hypothetical protein
MAGALALQERVIGWGFLQPIGKRDKLNNGTDEAYFRILPFMLSLPGAELLLLQSIASGFHLPSGGPRRRAATRSA